MWTLAAKERDVSFRSGSIGRFAKKHGIEMDFTPVQGNPHRNPQERRHPSRHYIVRFTRPGKEYTTPFSMGFGIPGPPTLSMVMSSIAMDAMSLEGARRDFLNYAEEYGIDPTDPWEQKNFLDFLQMMDDFKAFLGPEAYKELLHDVPEIQER